MNLMHDAELLRIYIGESDWHDRQPLWEAVVHEARRRGMAGATVTRGIAGFGAHSRIHHGGGLFQASSDLPLIVEICDRPDSIANFLPWLDSVIGEGLITIEPVKVLAYRHRDSRTSAQES